MDSSLQFRSKKKQKKIIFFACLAAFIFAMFLYWQFTKLEESLEPTIIKKGFELDVKFK